MKLYTFISANAPGAPLAHGLFLPHYIKTRCNINDPLCQNNYLWTYMFVTWCSWFFVLHSATHVMLIKLDGIFYKMYPEAFTNFSASPLHPLSPSYEFCCRCAIYFPRLFSGIKNFFCFVYKSNMKHFFLLLMIFMGHSLRNGPSL